MYRLYNLVETTDMDIDDFRPRIREHWERQQHLEASRYTIPMPIDSRLSGVDAEEMALRAPVLSTVSRGGRWRTRTSDLRHVKAAL